MPQETQAIFEMLVKGVFISGDSQKTDVKTYFKVIETDDNYTLLADFFRHIGFELMKGNEYYYFSKQTTNKKIEDKIKAAYEWIDMLAFLVAYGRNIDKFVSVGYIFRADDIFVACRDSAVLMKQLNDIVLFRNVPKPLDKINKLIDKLVKASFAESYNDFNNEYKIVAAFDYLEQLIYSINIAEDDEFETSK